ncbi:hypothetical protein [Streptomyces fragilis]|nr:hypothetical protein [Streptomyces fragilis]
MPGWRAAGRAGFEPASVSYTPLDVYKRQIRTCVDHKDPSSSLHSGPR